jgi:hypothetical protein
MPAVPPGNAVGASFGSSVIVARYTKQTRVPKDA